MSRFPPVQRTRAFRGDLHHGFVAQTVVRLGMEPARQCQPLLFGKPVHGALDFAHGRHAPKSSG